MKKTGLKNDKVINFRWDNKGKALVARRAKANEMSKEAYLRLAVEYEAHMRPPLNVSRVVSSSQFFQVIK